jgi:hypothetical protein
MGKFNEEELTEARDFVASRIGNINPTPEQLWEMCAKLQAKIWRLENGLEKFDESFSLVCERGEAAQRQNAQHLEKSFEDIPASDASDHLYRLRHIKENLRPYDLHPPDSTLRRWIDEAWEAKIFLIDEQTPEDRPPGKTAWSRDQLLQFIRWKIPAK